MDGSVHFDHHLFVDWNGLERQFVNGNYLEVLMLLTCACLLAGVEIHEARVQGLHGHNACFKVFLVKKICLLLEIFGHDQHVERLDWELVEQQSVSLGQVVDDADARFKWLQEHIRLPEIRDLLAGKARPFISFTFTFRCF